MVQHLLVGYQRAAPVVIFLLVLAVTAISVVSLERGERDREYAKMSRVALAAASALERRASINASYLRAGAAVFAMQPAVTEPLFTRFVTELRLDTDYRGAEGIGWAPYVTQGGRVRTPVTFLLPDSARNRRAFGFDMFSEPVRRTAMTEAIRSARPTASGRVILKQEGGRPVPGFLIYMPVYGYGPGGTRPRGFIYSPYSAQVFLSAASEALDLDGLRVTLYDGVNRQPFGAIGEAGEAKGRVLVQEMRLANRPMVLEVAALGGRSLSTISMITLLFGLAVASLLMLVSRLLTKRLVEDQRALAWFAEQNSIRNSLTRELNHRVKNTLANVLSIVTLTRRRAKTLDEFADGLDGRIRALSATHDLLTQSEWGTTPIAAVAAAELAPYTRSEDGVLDMDGPPVELAPNDALSLGLALHELATNASKYGALSVPGGRVSIRWALAGPDLARIDWRETGGPAVSEMRPRGFGTDLIEKIVAHELRNPVELVFAPEGVRCTLKVPVRQPSDFALRGAPRVTGH
ncbi:CHASE domain-containing protein [Qipengyuania sediminis]|uniref:CHASE domain-containing protein n=1 Tax=Qipengyuania sediminis TaxID=1532023 RepID=UPI00105A9E44|nr:CHASE domain-containing protein [Qipengyuania sediminis]